MENTVRNAARERFNATILSKSTELEVRRGLRDDTLRLADELSALLPAYWSWVAPSQYQCDRDKLLLLRKTAEERLLDLPRLEHLHQELEELEHTFSTALDGPPQRRRRKTFI